MKELRSYCLDVIQSLSRSFWNDNFYHTRKNFPDAQKLSGQQCQLAIRVFRPLYCIVNLGLADEAGVEVQVVWHDDRTHCCHTLSIVIDGGVRKMQRKVITRSVTRRVITLNHTTHTSSISWDQLQILILPASKHRYCPTRGQLFHEQLQPGIICL